MSELPRRDLRSAARVGWLVPLACWFAGAAAAEDEAPHFKLTAGAYQVAGTTVGTDLNLRYSGPVGNVWIGNYRDRVAAEGQWRAGWDSSIGDTVRVAPSLQLASGGFVGGSLQAELGAPYFAGVGLGRTNLRPYWNLNFDPNDSWLLTAGYRGSAGESLAMQYVRDNREHPDQRHLHLVYRRPLTNGERLTADILYKHGMVDDTEIRRWGLALTYDWPRVFLRLAYDPKVNFTPDNMMRASIGTRF
jgi:hypothetical protein